MVDNRAKTIGKPGFIWTVLPLGQANRMLTWLPFKGWKNQGPSCLPMHLQKSWFQRCRNKGWRLLHLLHWTRKPVRISTRPAKQWRLVFGLAQRFVSTVNTKKLHLLQALKRVTKGPPPSCYSQPCILWFKQAHRGCRICFYP